MPPAGLGNRPPRRYGVATSNPYPKKTTLRAVLALLLSLACGVAAMDVLDLQRMLDEAVANKAAKVSLPKGRVAIKGRLTLNKADGLLVEGDGTTLVLSDKSGVGWSFNSCKNIVLRGFAIDYDPVPFIQSRITGRSEDGKVYEFEVAEGYPGLREEDQRYYRQGYVFEPKRRRWKPWVPDLYARKVEIVDARHGKFIMGYTPPGQELVKVGDRLVLTIRSAPGIRMNDCENVRLEDITFYAAPGAAYLGRYMRGDNYYRYTIEPGEPPTGTTEERLISTCADGLNIAFATKGPTIERCKFSFMGDDSVNLHGATFAVVGAPSKRVALVAWPYSTEYLPSVVPVGTEARRLRADNYQVLARGEVTSFAPLKDVTPEQMAMILKVWPRNEKGRGTVFRLELADDLDAQPGEFLDLPGNNAPEFVIRDCEFRDHRARGLRIMACDGLIERNVFERLKHSAITMGAEYEFWREAGWVENIVVRDNVIEDVGRDTAMLGRNVYSRGAINVFARAAKDSPVPVWPGNCDIAIDHNTIRDCPAPGIRLVGASHVRVEGNRIENVGYRTGEESGQAIEILDSENVLIKENVSAKVGEEPDRE
jgi:hypothetical protein